MVRIERFMMLVAACLAGAAPAATPVYVAGAQYGYADIADLATAAPIVARATIAQAIVLKGADAAGAAAGTARLFVRAALTGLLRGPAGMSGDVNFLADVALDSRGRAPKLRKADVLLFAAPAAAGGAGALRLATPDGMIGWTPALDARLRAILTALIDPAAPPRITGVNNAFHVGGTLPGESETQIFLTTANGQPVSLAVLRRPGEAPRWAVALSEMVDEAAAPPARETLVWYRLACELPRALPAPSAASLPAEDAAAASADYRVVLDGLGACGRTRPGSGASG